ncbi:signal peptidase II [Aquimarina sp. AD10]|uniref:signal peptidase II n=1 Tax=Aquimarina sp. AD10 TaxID=1714849 RepID=UPI000E47CEA4|nr:signal peptidase II [Aquimarina sp. AD10]AXT63351.1 signal peptidase II [Aquimarina sp. AD10]RKN00636.1 signal peptidase II [Aquimarina sp. AD10]
MKFKKPIKILFSLIIILSNISCDQITKEKVRQEISKNETIKIIGDNFILTKVENTGAALSLGENLTPNAKIIFLQVLPLLVLIFMFIYIIKEKKISKFNLIGFSFIIGGGIGNIYDRILFNSVTDFMYVEFGSLHTGIFNMADVSVVIGTLFILLNSILSEINKKRYNLTRF